MATRSTLAVVHSDGRVSQGYCHWDGYVQYNGQILERFYNTRELAEELVSYGDASALGSTIGVAHDFNDCSEYDENNISTQCTFYARDRGETGTEARVFVDIEDYENHGQVEEYNYLFLEGAWYVKAESYGGRKNSLFSDLIWRVSEAIERADNQEQVVA